MDPMTQNNSTAIPDGIKRWSWGAFLMTWIWGLGNRTYVALLALVPIVGIFAAFYLGFKGNELAWKNKPWSSVEAFHASQKKWAVWGFVFAGIALACAFMYLLLIASVMTKI